MDLEQYYAEAIGFIITLLTGLALKDWSMSFVKGASFRLSNSFKEGDKVILDGQVAMIIKIGFTQTVFGVYSDDGYTWRYIPNQKIDSIKLEKVVDQDLHADSAIEKAEKLRKILEAKDV